MFDDSCIRVPLPSSGIVYGSKHPCNLKTQVYIKPMTPAEENIIFNRTFHKDGTLTARLIKSCVLIPELTIEQAEELVSGDKQAILLSLRISGYGSLIEGELKCPVCEVEQEYHIYLSQARINEFNPSSEDIRLDSETDHFLLDFKENISNLTSPLRFKYPTKLELNKTESEEDAPISEFLSKHLIGVGLSKINNFPASFARKIKKLIELNRPWVYIDFNFSCTSCSYIENKSISCDETLFPLKPEDREAIFLEPWFILNYYAGMDWETYLRYPVELKRWHIKRIEKEIKKASDNKEDITSKAPHENTPQYREMAGKTKPFTPNAKMQRF